MTCPHFQQTRKCFFECLIYISTRTEIIQIQIRTKKQITEQKIKQKTSLKNNRHNKIKKNTL